MYDIEPITSGKMTDCGPTCLKMLLAYYGIEVDLDTLIEECRTGIAGCTARDLKRVGNEHGLDMCPYKIDAETLLAMDRPSIIWWKYDHWCICCGEDNGQAVIINPDRGRYHMSKGSFASFYTEVALFNGEPVELPVPPTDAERIKQLEDELAAAKILLGVE